MNPERNSGQVPPEPVTTAATADRRMEIVVGRLLQVGVLVASATVLLGGVLYLRAHAGETLQYGTFHGESAALRNTGSVLRGAAHGDAAALIQLGVLLLIATPVARVAVMAVGFVMERDRMYLAISLSVLAVLLAGLLHGF